VNQPTRPTALVVEDERHLADLYAEYLQDAYEVRTAYSGDEAAERLSAAVDVAVVDRRMPHQSGPEVVAELTNHPSDVQITMLTDADPEFDIIDLGIEDYIVKPVTREELLGSVDRLVAIATYRETMRELTEKKLTRNVLRVGHTERSLRKNTRYTELETTIGRLETELETLRNRLDLDTVNLTL
jgi:DNA-binding response OmpR family regulator